MDPRLEFTFQLLMDATGLPRNEIMDHVFEGDMVLFCFSFKVYIFFVARLLKLVNINFDIWF